MWESQTLKKKEKTKQMLFEHRLQRWIDSMHHVQNVENQKLNETVSKFGCTTLFVHRQSVPM